MNFVFEKKSTKFLSKLDNDILDLIKQKLNKINQELDTFGYIKSNEIDVKKLKGSLFPKKRLRLGNIRIIFDYEFVTNTITIFDIDYRGNIY